MRTITLSVILLAMIPCISFMPVKTLLVTSPAFAHNGPIPVKYTCMGQQASPPLTIGNIPPGTQSLAIIVDDPDATVRTTVPVMNASYVTTPVKKGSHKKKTMVKKVPTSVASVECGYTYWLIWNIDVDANIPENFKNSDEGLNTAKQVGYIGLCPSSGAHFYHFRVFALDTKLNLGKNSCKADLEKVMQGHILAKGEIVGKFDKTYR